MSIRAMTKASCENLANNVSLYVGQPTLDSIVFERKLFVIKPKQMQDRGVEIIKRVDVLHGSASKFVGDAVAGSTFDTSTS